MEHACGPLKWGYRNYGCLSGGHDSMLGLVLGPLMYGNCQSLLEVHCREPESGGPPRTWGYRHCGSNGTARGTRGTKGQGTGGEGVPPYTNSYHNNVAPFSSISPLAIGGPDEIEMRRPQ